MEAARLALQDRLAAALASVPGASALLSLECIHAAPPPPDGAPPPLTIFYATGFLTHDADGAQSLARVSALHEALPVDAAALNFVRVAWACGSEQGAAKHLQHVGLALVVPGLALQQLWQWAGGGQPASSGSAGELDFHAKHCLAKSVGRELARVLRALAAERVVLLGHSLGGRVVLHALAQLAREPTGGGQAVVAAAALFGAAQAGPEDKAEDWHAALRALPAAGRLCNVFNPHDPALAAMFSAGKALGVDGRVPRLPAGQRAVAVAEEGGKLVNVDASPHFEGAGQRFVHSYRAVYPTLLRAQELAPLWAQG